jgi:hypothetical protein
MPNEEDIVRSDPVQNQDSAPHKTNAWHAKGPDGTYCSRIGIPSKQTRH